MKLQFIFKVIFEIYLVVYHFEMHRPGSWKPRWYMQSNKKSLTKSYTRSTKPVPGAHQSQNDVRGEKVKH